MPRSVRICLAAAAVLVLATAGAGAEPVVELTELQNRLLGRVFGQHTFAEAKPAGGMTVAVRPHKARGVYRLGRGGDVPAALTVKVAFDRNPGTVDLTWVVRNVYGQTVDHGVMRGIEPDEGGVAAGEIVLEGLDVVGYYHVEVSAAAGTREATGVRGIVLAPRFAGRRPESPFGFLADPDASGETVLAARRLGAAHVALAPEGAAPYVAASEPDTRPSVVVPVGEDQTERLTRPRWIERISHVRLGRDGALPPPGEAAAYREALVKRMAALEEAGQTSAVGGGLDLLASMFGADGRLDGVGVALVADAEADEPNLRSGAFVRSVDHGLRLAKRAGAEDAWVGATGDDPNATSPQRQAWKLVTRHVLAHAVGSPRVYTRQGRGLPGPSPAAAAHAVLADLLDRAVYAEDMWPGDGLIHAHRYAAPGWNIAVVWSWAGESHAEPDRGVLVFERGAGLEVRDAFGHPVGIWKGRRLVVPLGEAPIFVVSRDLSTDEFRDRFRKVRIGGTAPATLWVRSIVRGDVPGRAEVRVWVQAHRPTRQKVRMTLVLGPGWRLRTGRQTFDLDPGEARDVRFEVEIAEEAAGKPGTVEAVAQVGENFVRRTQVVQTARAARRTIRVGGGIGDWGGVRPVLVPPDVQPTARVWTAWDEENFYLAAAVPSDENFRQGRFAFEGDALQLGFAAGERADDDFGHPARGAAMPVGAVRDTDHLFAVTFSADGAEVIRLRAPGGPLAVALEGVEHPGYGPVEGAKASVAYDANLGAAVYEVAIPWSAVDPIRPGRGRTFGFGFGVGGAGGKQVTWARAAGVPDFWANPGSLLPLGRASLPCRTRWSLGGPVDEE